MEHNAAQRYLNQVSRFLVCTGGDRKRLLGRCRELADSFQQENPDAEYDGFVSAFGKPADCAAELLSTLDASAIESAQKKRLWTRNIMVVCVLSVLIFLSFFWYSKYKESIAFDETVTVVIKPPSECTEEEFYAAKEWEAQFNNGGKS